MKTKNLSHKQIIKLALVFMLTLAVVSCQGEVEATHPPSTPTHTLVLPTATSTPTLTSTPIPTPTPTPFVLSGKLAYILGEDGWFIVVYDLVSGASTRYPLPDLETPFGQYAYFSASPDGRYLAYETHDAGREVYILDLVEEKATNISNHPWSDYEPVWSPDGSKVAFVSHRNANADIYIYDIHTKTLKNLTKHPADDASPSWSPDGRQIAFVSTREGDKNQLFIINIDDGNVIRLTNNENPYMQNPKWSPAGEKIAFYYRAEGLADNEIYIVNPDGTNLKNLSEATGLSGEYWESNFSWSPDGTKILLGLGGHIYTVDVKTLGVIRIRQSGGFALHPTWSPDGRMIAYALNRTNGGLIFVMDAEGKGLPLQVTEPVLSIWYLLWLP